MPATNSTFWRDHASALRERADSEEGERRQVLLVLADDCDELAAELEGAVSAAR